MRHDLTLESIDLNRDGALVPGAGATYDGTQMHGSPLPIHVKAYTSAITLVYQFQYTDRRVRVDIIPGLSPCFACPVCQRACTLLRLTDTGDFVCEVCVPFAPHPSAMTMRRKRAPAWEKMQARTLEIRKALRDYTSAPRAMKWRPNVMPKGKWKALVDELKELEPKMVAAYLEHAKTIVDTITGIQGPFDEQATKSPPVAGNGSSD